MSGRLDYKRKIKAVANIAKVTKAMETMASIKYQKSSRLAVSAASYSEELHSFVSQLVESLSRQTRSSLKLCEVRKTGLVLFVVFTSDKGMCGALNTALLHKVEEAAQEEKAKGRRVRFITVGKKGSEFLKRRGFDVISGHNTAPFSNRDETARDLVREAAALYKKSAVEEVYLFYNHFVSASKAQISALRLLPLIFEEEKHLDHIPVKEMPLFSEVYPNTQFHLPPFVFEPDSRIFLEEMLIRYLETMVVQVILDSDASENAARMIAMQQATENAKDMIEALTLAGNKARQSQITGDLIEITGSAEALK
ncbi:MAG: ATP synthase F1 subunit gamma [Candidatus Margulisiibacteriota bacterium]